MSDIADACGLLKGSIYHYFPGKEALMQDVIEYVHQYFREEVLSIAYKDDLLPQQRLDRMFEMFTRSFMAEQSGDIMGNIGVETAWVIPEFASLIQQFFLEWFKAQEHIYSEVMSNEAAKVLAEQTVAEIEGSVMMTRILKDPKYLRNATARISGRFAELISTNSVK